MENEIVCKYCHSDNVIKFGTQKGTQQYYCKDCGRKFGNTDTIPMMQTPTDQIASSLNMYYEGMSLNEIRRNLIQQHDNPISDVTALNWVRRFTEFAVKEADKHKPKVGDLWVADETVIDIDGKNIWFWDIIDTKTRFLIASHMSFSRTTKDAQKLMEKAYKHTGKYPRVIYTDKLQAYLDGIELTFGAETKHSQGSPFDIENNTNMIERFHGTIKERTKVMRGLHTIDTARDFMNGWLIHYNFFRPHMSLDDKTPAEVAGITFPFKNWKEVVEQPYEITARIEVMPREPRTYKSVVKRKPKTRGKKKITPSVMVLKR